MPEILYVYVNKYKEYYKHYYKVNREEILQKNKNYYYQNRDKILQKNKEPFTCYCGSICRMMDCKAHFNTDKHKNYVRSLKVSTVK